MNKMNLNYQNTESGVNITLHKNYMNTAAANYYRVQRKTADIESLIATIQQKDTGINQFMIMHCATLLKESILKKIGEGNSVDVFGLGTFFLTATPNKEDAAQTNLTVSFSPSAEVQSAAANVSITAKQEENTNPVIESLKDLFTKKEDDSFTATKSFRISGKKLKIAGEESTAGIFFAPCDTDGNYDTSGADWIQIKESGLETNLASTLSSYLPNTINAGLYRLIIKTLASVSGNGTNKAKVRSCVYGNIVTVQ